MVGTCFPQIFDCIHESYYRWCCQFYTCVSCEFPHFCVHAYHIQQLVLSPVYTGLSLMWSWGFGWRCIFIISEVLLCTHHLDCMSHLACFGTVWTAYSLCQPLHFVINFLSQLALCSNAGEPFFCCIPDDATSTLSNRRCSSAMTLHGKLN